MTRYLLLFGIYGLVFVGRLLYMLLALASAVFLGSESLGTRDHIFTVSDLRLPFSSPPMTRRVTVEVFDPASTRDRVLISAAFRYRATARTAQKTPLPTLLAMLRACVAAII
jgi:hypothetical protein